MGQKYVFSVKVWFHQILRDLTMGVSFISFLQTAQPDPIEIQRQQEARRRAIARKRAKAQLKPRSPEPVEGRKHIDVQTELYLEELSDRVEEADVQTQTDAFLDRPPSPLFIPAKSGVDVATQILEGEVSFCYHFRNIIIVFATTLRIGSQNDKHMLQQRQY